MSAASVSFQHRFWACAFGSLSCAGCLGGQTGGEDVPPGETPAGYACQDTARELEFDEQSPLGASAADVLGSVPAPSTSALSWNADTAPVAVGPEQGQSSIEITLEYRGGRVAWIDSEQGPSDAESGEPAPAALAICTDRLELDVIARVVTAGRALDEELEVRLVATGAARAGFSRDIALGDLAGALSVSAPDGVSAPLLSIRADWDEVGFHGTIGGSVSVASDQRGDTAASARQILYAEWPPPGTRP